ncbi:MAG: DUF898 family protein [Clostridia bacterium]|nr:DUF898 family protein [Clostridia bacterium]
MLSVARILLVFGIFAVLAIIAIVLVAVLSKSKNTETAETKDGSYFDGGTLGYIGYSLLVGFVTSITLGIAFPWMCCLMQRWIAKHTVVCGKRMTFDGTGVQLIGRFLLWGFLTIITFGIYGFWMSLAIKKWITKHTHFVGEEDNNSYFDGGIGGLIGTNILATLVTIVPFVGFAWSNIIRLRWERKHTVVDSRRLSFEGTVGTFFLKYLLWGFLTIITLGIYGLFVPVKNLKLEAENTLDHEHTPAALMAQSEYRNTVQNTVSANKNYNTEFEMEGLKAGINDTTDEAALRAAADGGLRCAQYLYVTRYADGQVAEEPYASMLKASAEAGYAPAMCLCALTNETDEARKNEWLDRAAEQGQIAAIHNRLAANAAAGLAATTAAAAYPLLKKAVFYADVLSAADEPLSDEEILAAKQCAMAIRKIDSGKSVSSKVGAGAIIGIVVAILALFGLLAAVAALFMGKSMPAVRDEAPLDYGNAAVVAADSL